MILRKPLPLIAVEQFFYPILWALGIVLSVSYIPQGLANINIFPAEDVYRISIWVAVLSYFSIFVLWLPFTCFRLWKSASKYSKGAKIYIYKAWAVIVGVPLFAYGCIFIFQLSEFISEYESM